MSSNEDYVHQTCFSDDECDGEDGDLEAMILGESKTWLASKSSTQGYDFGKKIDLSVKIQNDIVRSEKKGERRPNYYGRDDRATSEQVLDPRTRLILFKLLSSGYLSEIDGEIFVSNYVSII